MEDLFFFIETLPRPRKPICILVWIDIIYHICKWQFGSGERGLFLKNVFQGGYPLQTTIQQFLVSGSDHN